MQVTTGAVQLSGATSSQRPSTMIPAALREKADESNHDSGFWLDASRGGQRYFFRRRLPACQSSATPASPGLTPKLAS
jgi:hypothetical protein